MAEVKVTPSKASTKVEPALATVKSVVGLLIHPFTQARFGEEPTKGVEVDWWVKNQHEAGKLIYVTE